MTTTLYRMYSPCDELLYVGISSDFGARISQHRATKRWYTSVSRIEVEHYPSRYDASIAEEKAVREELPAFNLQYRVDDDDVWELLLARVPGMFNLMISSSDEEPDYVPTYCQFDHWFGAGSWRPDGVKDRMSTLLEAAPGPLATSERAYAIAYRRLLRLLPVCSAGCTCPCQDA